MSENTNKTYNLVFEQKIKEGFELDVVKKNLEQFFNNNADLVKQLFSKEKTILKRNLSQEVAEKYKTVLEGTGACCIVVENIQEAPAKTIPKDSVSKKLNDLDTVTRFLLKVTSLNQKIMWFTFVVSLLSIILWASFFFDVIGSPSKDNTSNNVLFYNDWRMLSIKGTINYVVNEDGSLFVKSGGKDSRILFSPLAFEDNTQYLIDVKLTSSVRSKFQVYYSDSIHSGANFSEKKSISFPIKKGDNSVRFFLENKKLGKFIRLDPLDKPGEITLKKVEVIRLGQ